MDRVNDPSGVAEHSTVIDRKFHDPSGVAEMSPRRIALRPVLMRLPLDQCHMRIQYQPIRFPDAFSAKQVP